MKAFGKLMLVFATTLAGVVVSEKMYKSDLTPRQRSDFAVAWYKAEGGEALSARDAQAMVLGYEDKKNSAAGLFLTFAAAASLASIIALAASRKKPVVPGPA